MKISAKEWLLFILISILCFGIWLKFSYSQFSFVDLSVNKNEALKRAESYLNALGQDTNSYSRAVVFSVDGWADRYLQKTIGLKQEEEFIKKYNYELFYWKVRFFKQFQKEEYIIQVSPRSGEILSFRHLIEDIASRPMVEKNAAMMHAQDFVKRFFAVNSGDYDFHEEKVKRYDKRVDYSFSWERKDVYIPWKKQEGGAKLLMAVTVSGNEIREFDRGNLDVPEKFKRHIENQLAYGEYLFSLYFLVFMFIVGSAIFIVIKRGQNVIARICKGWFLSLALFIVIINLFSVLNNFQSIIIRYPTSASLSSFFGIYVVQAIINLIFVSLAFVLPGIAGETLHSEVFQDRPYGSFTHYLKTTFYSRNIARAVLFGYVLFFIMLGLQSAIFYLGQQYLGVWKEWVKLTQFSSAYVPFFSAFTVGITASFSEEVIFRLFGISWGRKYLRNTCLAVLFISLIWGFGHSEYAIFPVWFRGIEVSIIGVLYGFIFVRYGLIPLIVSHYLFDVFWGIAAHILGHTTRYLFIGSAFVLALPLIFACIAYFVNQKEEKQQPEHIKIRLNNIQRYNLDVLVTYISAKKNQGHSSFDIRTGLIEHGWDIDLVDLAINEVFKI